MDKTSFLKYLELGDRHASAEVAEDFTMLDLTTAAAKGWFPPMKALPKPQYPTKPGREGDLQEHDRRWHPEGYKEGDRCKYREELAKRDLSDKIVVDKEAELFAKRLAYDGGFTSRFVDATKDLSHEFYGGKSYDGARVFSVQKDDDGYEVLVVYRPQDGVVYYALTSPDGDIGFLGDNPKTVKKDYELLKEDIKADKAHKWDTLSACPYL